MTTLLGFSAIVVASLLVVFIALAGPRLARGLASAKRARRVGQRTIVVGSGDAAVSLIRLAEGNPNFAYTVVGCVDDQILRPRVAGKPILGSVNDLPGLVGRLKIACIIIAIPNASTQLVKQVVDGCSRARGLEGGPPAVQILPGVLELLKDHVKSVRVRPIQPEDLLSRDSVRVDLAEIAPYVTNQTVLVTGAGGSIGSELCRQIVGLNPSLLLLLGHGENSLFEIDEELRFNFDFHRTKIILADVADATRIRSIFSKYRPHVVFHSAAHKHVPIVENNVCEAIRNNILGTHVVALAAAAVGAAKFVLLSTDKAVNPASVMGATKRVAELITQSFHNQTGTEFVTVRFGNVLGSRGSVIPTFKKQIESGGPVTITHREMKRYFMTIPEAVSLVLLAMAIGRDGQVLVFDMGEQVAVLHLAEKLISLSGLTPHRDIRIVETGVRPGEKLYEEVLASSEDLSQTSHAYLLIARSERMPYDQLAVGLQALETSVQMNDQAAALNTLRELVPSFQPGEHLFGSADGVIGLPAALSGDGKAAAAHNGRAELADVGDPFETATSARSQSPGE